MFDQASGTGVHVRVVVIARSKPDQQRQPEESSKQDDPDQSATVTKIHEKEYYQQHFAERDGERRTGVLSGPRSTNATPVVRSVSPIRLRKTIRYVFCGTI